MKLIKIRLSGDTDALSAVLGLLVAAVQNGGAEIADQSGLYPNRRESGARVYLTLLLPDPAETSAGRRTTAKQSAAPLPSIPAQESQEGRHLP